MKSVYKGSLRERNIRACLKGDRLDSATRIDHPFIRGHVQSAVMTYALTGNKEYTN